MQRLEDVVLKLAHSHILLVNAQELAAALKRLQEAQTETQERLGPFIVVVEKYISSRNGGEKAAQ